MRFRLLSLLMLSLPALMAGCKGEKMSSNWLDQKITIDGDISDWQNIPVKYYDKHNMQMRFANDAANLYIMCGFRDPFLARMLQRSGFSLWFDRNGGRKREFGIRYRSVIPQREMFSSRNDSLAGGPPEQMGQFREIMGTLNIVLNDDSEISPPPSPSGPSCASKLEDGLYLFEFMVPLRKTENTAYAIEAVEGKDISICMQIGKLNDEELSKMREAREGEQGGDGEGPEGEEGRGGMGGRRGGMGGGPGGGMGGMGGGMPGGMGGGMGGPGGFERPQPLNMWLAVALAVEAQGK